MSQENLAIDRGHLITLLGLIEVNIFQPGNKRLDASLKSIIDKHNSIPVIRGLWELSEVAINISDFANNRQLSLYDGVENDLILKNISASTGIPKNSLYALCNLIHTIIGCDNAIELLKKTLELFYVSIVDINPDNIEPYSFSYNEDDEVFLDVGAKQLDVKFLEQVLKHFDKVCQLQPFASISEKVKLANASRIE